MFKLLVFVCLLIPLCSYAHQQCDASIQITVTARPSENNGNNQDAIFDILTSGQWGYFANGDLWIAPAPGDTSVSLTDISGNGQIFADENPQIEAQGILSAYGNYVASERITWPQTYTSDTSIVAAKIRDEAATSNCGTSAIVGSCVDAWLTITVLMTPPANDGADHLPPAYSSLDKSPIPKPILTSLPQTNLVAGTTTQGYADIAMRWRHHLGGFRLQRDKGGSLPGEDCEGGRCWAPHILVDDYAAGEAQDWADDVMTVLSSDDPIADKEQAIYAMYVYGYNFYAMRYGNSGRFWGTGAGQHLGRYPATAFSAAIALANGDSAMALQLKRERIDIDDNPAGGPHELDQINGINQIYGYRRYPDGSSTIHRAYWADLVNSQGYDGATGTYNPSVGKRIQQDPYGLIDGPPNRPMSSYGQISIGGLMNMMAIAFVWQEYANIVNWAAVLPYIDYRLNNGARVSGDVCAPPTNVDADCDPWDSSTFVSAVQMEADSSCPGYGSLYGPDPSSAVNGVPTKCITNSQGQNGRFGNQALPVTPSFLGTKVDWSTLRPLLP